MEKDSDAPIRIWIVLGRSMFSIWRIVTSLKSKTPPATIKIPITNRRGQIFRFNYLIFSPFSAKYRMAPG